MNYNNYMTAPVPQMIDPYKNMGNMINQNQEKPDIAKFMHDYNDQTTEKFNEYWFERSDDDIIRGIEQIILSCQRDKYFLLKVLNFEVIKDYEEIQNTLYNWYANKSINGKKVDNPYDYIDLGDSDIMLLKVTYYIKINVPEDKIRVDSKTGKPEQSEGTLEVLIMLPRFVNKYYFRIQGNYYNPVFQIVDGSTYNNATSSNSKVQTITLKNQFMPIKVYKEYYELTDFVSGETKRCVLYTSYTFTKKTDAMKFILGRYGFYGAIDILGLEDIYICDMTKHEVMDPEKYYNFSYKHDKISVAVLKEAFDKDNMTQSFVFTILKNFKRAEKYEDVFDPRYWNKSLGGDFSSATLDKGISVLDSFEAIYDLKTKETINLPEEDKSDTYHILIWMMREFNYLRSKDNLDISTKRPRMADEYIAAIYAFKLSKGIYRISDRGKNISYKEVVQAIRTDPNYILKNINTSNLVNFVNLVNDNDAELALAYTYKGISGLGDQNSSSAVPLIYRSVHPSHLGRVDLDSSSASDPGLSGVICPTAKIYDGYFSDYQEPNSWKDFYRSMMTDLHSLHGMEEAIQFKKKLGLDYDKIKEDMVKETISTYRRLLPAVFDVDKKKDYTMGAVMPTEDELLLFKGLGYIGDGDITYSEEVPLK